MAGVNRVIILGNLGRDPKTNANGTVSNFSIATSEKWLDKSTGEQTDKTEWHNIVAFGKLAEIVDKYLKKGSKVYIEGKLQTRKWTDKNGVEKLSTEIICNSMQMLGGKNNDADGSDESSPGDDFSLPGILEKKPAAVKKIPSAGDFDDEIPF